MCHLDLVRDFGEGFAPAASRVVSGCAQYLPCLYTVLNPLHHMWVTPLETPEPVVCYWRMSHGGMGKPLSLNYHELAFHKQEALC